MAYIGHSASGNFTTKPSKDTFSGDGSTTAFTLSEGATTNTVDVFVENVRQEPTTAYSVNGTTLTFTEAPGSGTNNIYVVNRGPLQLSATHPAAQALEASTGTFTGDLTVDTNTLKVDSTNNRVGIGTTTTDDAALTITNSVTRVNSWDAKLALQSTANSDFPALLFSGAANTNRYGGIVSTIDTTGNTPANQTAEINFALSSTTAGNIAFRTNGNIGTSNTSERMRISSAGTVMVGKTASDSGVAGFEARSTGETFATASGTAPFYAHRLSDDGDIAIFQAAGTTVAKITVSSSDNITFGATAASGSGLFYFSGSGGIPIILPTKGGSLSDNEVDLGRSAQRFQDAFIVNGVTTGSDQNEKQQIASLTSAEIAAAKRISTGFKTFKWNSAVTKKGDSARTHTGVIAQEVRTALEAEGLDAGNYAFFMSNTFWEKDVEVAAVEAKDAVTRKVIDTDGNEIEEVVTPAVEARDAFTRTDVYETEDEAPEGATKVTRLGIRYPELLAFVGAATEQRLANIETRLAALEAG